MTETIRALAYDDSHYKNSIEAARLLSESNDEPKTIREYVNRVSQDLSESCKNFLLEHEEELQKLIDTTPSQKLDYFSITTYQGMYSISRDSNWFEGPKFVWLRVAVHLHQPNVKVVSDCYRELMAGLYTPSTPTIIGAGTRVPALAACYLGTFEDSRKGIHIDGIYRASEVLNLAGGFGVDLSQIRHSEMSNGIMTGGILPVVQLFNAEADYIRGRRRGTITLFLNCWHLDAEDFCSSVKKTGGDRKLRAHDINIGLWTYNLFWRRIRENGNWTFFCPKAAPELLDVYGEEFERRYLLAEQNPDIKPEHKKTVKALEFYQQTIVPVLNGAGMPYIMNRDPCNMKSNHRHLGPVGTNVCLEIIQHVSNDSAPVCNLHSISLRKFVNSPVSSNATVDTLKKHFNFEELGWTTRMVTRNINRMMETGQYPLDNGEERGIFHKTNDANLPIAIGIAGFADMLYKLDLCFTSPLTKDINKMVSACIYFNALATSVDAAIVDGPYPTFVGSPTSEGKLQFDLWREEFEKLGPNPMRKAEDDIPVDPISWGQTAIQLLNGEILEPSWDSLKKAIMKHGLRNSLVTAYMPTATSAHLRRNTESFEPPQSNIVTKRTITGSFNVVNRYLVKDLEAIGLWNEKTHHLIKRDNGSVQGLLEELPNVENPERLKYLCEKYQTAWEISQRHLMILCADRSRYVDQSCSFNIHMKESSPDRALAAHLTAAQLGLKTMSYYWRVQPASSEKLASMAQPRRNYTCTDEICTACSS